MLIKAANSSYEREITAGIAKPVGQDISIEFAAAPELFDHYRQAFYDEDVKLLSEEFYQSMRRRPGYRPEAWRASRDDQVRRREPAGQERALCTARDDPFGVGYRRVAECPQCFTISSRVAALINVVAGITENRAWPDWKDRLRP